ncbi:TPA: hypothetical protein ACH2JW_001450 [Serratia marcescens]|uniref:hypothetical protein n=1 Tax=Serratia marcescens TaxID=615 RepID=UPI0037682B7F
MTVSKTDIDPSYIPHSLVVLDSIFFIGFLIAALIILYFFYKKYELNRSFAFLLFTYIIFSYSSYNIMVMPIHDFNIPIARTFIYHYKVIGLFSSADIFFLAMLSVCLVQWAMNKGIKPSPLFLRVSPFIKLTAVQGTILFSFSLLGYIIHVALDGVGSVRNQLLYARGIVYFIALMLVFFRASSDIGKLRFGPLLLFLCAIDFINFISGLIGTYIYTDYVWERYGVKVSIIDQDNIYNYFTLYLFVLVSLFFANKKRFSLSLMIMVVIAIGMLLNVYKFLFAISVLYLLYEIFFRLVTRQLPRKRIILLLIITAALTPSAIKIFTSKAMNTRASQLHDYWQYTGRYLPANLIGIGHGGLYLSPTGVADKGEIKRIDMDANGEVEYKRSIQTPLLTQIKNSGIVGLIVMLITAALASYRLFVVNIKLKNYQYATPICFNLIWIIGFVCVVVQPYPMPVLTLVKLLMLLGLLLIQRESRQSDKESGADS